MQMRSKVDVKKMDVFELKRFEYLMEEIKLCGEIYNDAKWENLDEWNRLIKKLDVI